jgi:hypothetical protein
MRQGAPIYREENQKKEMREGKQKTEMRKEEQK